MVEAVFPEAVTALGRKKVLILTTEPGAPAAIPVATMTAAVTAGLEATMYFLGGFAPSGSQNKGTGPRRVGEGSQLQRLGLATYEAPRLEYVHDPQGADSDVANKVRTALTPGTEVWIVERAGIDVNTAVVATNKYRLHHLELGEQFFGTSGEGEFDIEQVMQETGYLTPPIKGVVAA